MITSLKELKYGDIIWIDCFNHAYIGPVKVIACGGEFNGGYLRCLFPFIVPKIGKLAKDHLIAWREIKYKVNV